MTFSLINLIHFADEGSFPMGDSKNELKRLRAMSKASKQAELKRYEKTTWSLIWLVSQSIQIKKIIINKKS